jgi:hypothetical protein
MVEDKMNSSDIEHVLMRCCDKLREQKGPICSTNEDISLPSSQGCSVLARAKVLLGRLIEWKDPAGAAQCYEVSIRADPLYAEGRLQLARLLWKTACCEVLPFSP